MMDLYSVLVEGLIGGPFLTWIVLAGLIFVYLAWTKVGVYSNLMILQLFSLWYFWITGMMLGVGIILIGAVFGGIMELKKELSDG